MKERGIFNFIFWREGLGSGLATTECLMLVIIVLVLSGEARCDTLSEIQVLARRIDSDSLKTQISRIGRIASPADRTRPA